LLERVRLADCAVDQALSRAVARYYFKLLAYKDEYEVARLYSEPAFRQLLEAQFEGDYRLHVHLAPSWLARADARSGVPRKREFGPWMLRLFGLLARLRGLRGSPFDPFARSPERRLERELIVEYEALVEMLLGELHADNYRTAVALAELPEQIRGYGHVKELAVARVREQAESLKARLRSGEIAAVRLYD